MPPIRQEKLSCTDLRRLGGGKSPCYLVFFMEKSPKILRANAQKIMKYLVK
jgi:hypothetical protein